MSYRCIDVSLFDGRVINSGHISEQGILGYEIDNQLGVLLNLKESLSREGGDYEHCSGA